MHLRHQKVIKSSEPDTPLVSLEILIGLIERLEETMSCVFQVEVDTEREMYKYYICQVPTKETTQRKAM